MNKLVAIVGMAGSGKSVASDFFENKGYKKVYFGGITMDKLREENIDITPENERMMRERLRKQHGMAAYAILSLPKIEKYLESSNVIIDGLYSWDELKVLKEKFPFLVLIAIIVNKDKRYERLSIRDVRPLTKEEANKRDVTEIENLAKAGPIAYADYFILNNDKKEFYINELESLMKVI